MVIKGTDPQQTLENLERIIISLVMSMELPDEKIANKTRTGQNITA